MKEFSDNVVEKIKQEHIAPKARWYFTARYAVLWMLLVGCLGFAAIALGVSALMMGDNDWDLAGRFSGGPVRYAVLTLPYFWLAMLVFFLALAYLYFRRTPHGYRHNTGAVVAAIIAAATCAGVFIYAGDLAVRADDFLGRYPTYTMLVHRPHERWMQPKAGYLAGTILEFQPERQFVLRDLSGQIWEVRVSTSSPLVIDQEHLHRRVKLIGTQDLTQHFQVEMIRPWGR